jgi:hypothetical protein
MADNKPTQVARTNQSALHDNGLRAGALIETSISQLSPDEVRNLRARAAEAALELEVKARTQNLDYVAGKKDIEDHIDTFGTLDKRGKTTRHSVTTDIKTGAGNMRLESKSGATCFVASTAYGDPNHPDVIYLRQFRDTVLSQSAPGRAFVAWYWHTGPKLARLIGWSTMLRSTARFGIHGLIIVLQRTRIIQTH